MNRGGHGLAEELAEVSRALQSEASAQETLQKIVELAVTTIDGCDHAGITIMNGRVYTPASSSEVPIQVDRIQYATDQGPCLDAIRHHQVYVTDDLLAEKRWPLFSARAVRETRVRSMLSFRLFADQDTLGSLNLYSRACAAFGEDSQIVGAVFASHASLAWTAAVEHEHIETMTRALDSSRTETRRYAEQAGFATALQHSMLTELPDLSPLQLTARYLPATRAAEIGGDWYDAFALPGGGVGLTVGDLAGHDIEAAVAMGQARNILRALAVDRDETPGRLLSRFDTVLSELELDRTATCVYGRLNEHEEGWRVALGNAGHLAPLLITEGHARYLELPDDPLLGTGLTITRRTTQAELPAGATLLLFTDGLIERRSQDLDDGLVALRDTAVALSGSSIDVLCDELLRRLVPEPTDDVCVLAVRVPAATSSGPAHHGGALTVSTAPAT